MEGEISSFLVRIREGYRNASTRRSKLYPCHLKNVNVRALELLEVVLDRESDIPGEGKQIGIPYSSLFDPALATTRSEVTLKPTSTTARNVILLQGEAAVGKTMLCLSVVEDWASGELFQEFQLILWLPLSSKNVVTATSLSGLLNVLYADFNADTCTKLANYLTNQKTWQYNTLLIADGWEGLDQGSQCQAGSFLHSLLFSSDIIPTSFMTVLITSRPGCIETNTQLSVDRLITLTGFDAMGIESIVQSEFASDIRRIHYLTAQLNENPLVASVCRTPLILAIVCNLCRVSDTEPLPDTLTKLYTKLIWALASASIKSKDPQKNSLSSHPDPPEELQQSWWQVCELAFRNIEKDHNTSSPSDAAAFNSSSKLSYFGLTKPMAETGDTQFSFVNPRFEEYLAALHLAKQSQETQLKFIREFVINEECRSKLTTTFWHFFISNYADQIASLNCDVVNQVLKILSAAYCNTKQSYCMDLCHLSYEAKNDVVNHKVVEAISIVGTGVLRFGHSRDAYDFNSIIYVLQNVTQESKVEINFQDCSLKPKHVIYLANALQEKSSIMQVKGLNLSGNKLSNSLAVDFFSRAIAALRSLKALILCNCDIGTTLDIKAILTALTESTSPTLSHFNLSFNPISISFLQVLQQHLESYDTFECLQNLGLKGSLKHDVTTSFLVNFSATLSSKCKHLRRLDLSENNLGEPGNPDLSKVISQLLNLGRDFNLCLNEEYMSEVNDEFICVMEESIKRKGTINQTIAHGVIVGPGRSGKNTLMSRLMGNGPPEPHTISPSTGVLENIVKVEVKKICTVAAAVNNLEWKKLKYDEEALELIMTTARYHSVTTTVSKPIVAKYIVEQTESPIITSAKPSITFKHLSKQRTKYKVFNLFKKLMRFKARRSNQDPVSEIQKKEKGAIVYTPDVEPVDIFKQAVKLRGMDALREHLESSWSLYLTNTGGQIEFQEHLPLLVCGPSIFFITFPLHHDLDKPYDVRYEYPDGRVETYKSPGTLLQELLQTLATINASHFTSGQQRQPKMTIKPKIFFIGTHKDCLPASSAEEIIQRKDELLQSCVRQTALFDQDAIQFADHPKQLIFVVNNLSDDDDEFQKIRSAVQMTVERDEFTVECPSSWLILSLILRTKHKSDQVLTFEECFSIARECGITDRKELNEALSFIHSKLGLVRYFNVKELNTLVVIDPQVLFDKITDLIVKTFTVENVGAKQIENFRQRGIIPVTVMQEISAKNGSDSQPPFTWLSMLLNYLRIAALFTDIDGDKYFFPSALCHAPKSHINLPPDTKLWPSMVVGFKSGFCPRGIPGALIKYLMTNEMKSKRVWNIIPNKIFRNEVSFAIQAHGNITLRILPTHMEISYYSETDSIEDESEENSKEEELMKKTCEMAYMQIKKGMSTITSQCMECKYFFGFYCTLATCQDHKHPAQLEWGGENPFKVVCKITNKRGNLPNGYEIWNLQKKCKPGKTQLDRVIDADSHGVPKHLGQVADSMTEWEGRISDKLKLTSADVASIHTKHPRNLKLQSREALLIWKQKLGSAATYRKLINIFECAGYCTYAEIVRNIICDTESEDDSSDYDEPILQPETYPHQTLSLPSPSIPSKINNEFSSREEYLLINRTNAQDLPKGDVYSQKVLDKCNVSVVPMLSSKHKPIPPALPSKSEPTVNYPIYVGKYDYDSQHDEDLSFKRGDLIYIISTDEGDRWFARLKDSGEEGYVPSSFLAKSGSILNFAEDNTAPEWIQVAIKKTKSSIKNAIEEDKRIPVTKAVKFSQSAVFTEGFLHQMGKFWKNLKCPEPHMSSCYAVMTVKGIAECCEYYVSECGKKLCCTEEKLANQKLFIFLNNVNHICNALSECSKWLELDPFYDWLEEEQKIGKRCKRLVEKIIQETQEVIHSCVTNNIMLEIKKKLVPNIQNFLQKLVEDAKLNVGDQSAYVFCSPLLDYLTDFLSSFVSSLHPSVATDILLYVWEGSVESVEKYTDKITQRRDKDSSHIYYRLFMALSLLREFFYVDGDGIAKKLLDTKKFENLHSRLYSLSKSTEELVFQYLSELARLQPGDDSEGEGVETFGTLHFSVAYLKDKSILEVAVIQAMDLPALGGDGSRNPYVQASLMPRWMFPHASQRTRNTTNPMIDEQMKLQAPEMKLDAENTMLVFTVFHRDLIRTDRFVGMCIVPCSNIPRLQGTDAERQRAMIFDSLEKKVFRLSLFHPPKASSIRAELECRAKLNDSKAKKIIETIPSPNLK